MACPDHKIHANKKGCVCKHICFVLIRILKYFKFDFYIGRKLSDEDNVILHDKLLQLSLTLDQQIINKDLKEKYDSLGKKMVSLEESSSSTSTSTLESALKSLDISDKETFAKSVEEELGDCPICFDILDKRLGVVENCLKCKNGIHEPCLKKWLEMSAHKDCRHTKCGNKPTSLACPYCRTKWVLKPIISSSSSSSSLSSGNKKTIYKTDYVQL